MSLARISLAMKRSRTELRHFIELSSIIENGGDSITEGQLIDYLEVCHYHLRRPTEQTLSRREEAIEWNLWVLMGLSRMNNGMIITHRAVRRKLDTCWPDAIKWAGLMSRGYLSNELFKDFCRAMGIIFYMMHSVSVPTEFLEGRGIFDLTVDLWEGTKSLAGVNIYTGDPLFVCLSQKCPWQMDRLLERTGYHPTQVASIVVDRLKRDAEPLDPRGILSSVLLLCKLVEYGPKGHPLSIAILHSDVPATISSNMTRLFPLKEGSTEAQEAIISSIRFLGGYTCENLEHVSELLNYGLLHNILETASMRHVEEADEIAKACLKPLVVGLQSIAMVNTMMVAFGNFYAGKHSVVRLVEQTSDDFKEYWEMFEAVLLEQLILDYLFKNGYSREQGACANQSCQKLADRRDFKKCEGCGFALYCSNDCQKQDWKRHRGGCKQIGKEDEMEHKEGLNRFSRRAATLQVRRYWSDIQSMAEKQHIPKNRIGVHLNFTEYPYELRVFNYEIYLSPKTLSDETDPLCSRPSFPYYPMVANEVLQRSIQGHCCVLLALSHWGSRCQLPSLAYLEEETNTSGPDLDQLLENLKRTNSDPNVLLHYVDERKKELSPRKRDVLGVTMMMAWSQLQNDRDKFWKELQFLGVAKKVLKMYRKGLVD